MYDHFGNSLKKGKEKSMCSVGKILGSKYITSIIIINVPYPLLALRNKKRRLHFNVGVGDRTSFIEVQTLG